MRTHFEAILFSLVAVRLNNKYLLVEERVSAGESTWYLPAGGVKPSGDFLAAAVRETQEEAGIIIEPLGLLGADQILVEDGQTTKIRIVFLGKMVGGSLKTSLDKESVRAAWFRPDEMRNLRLRDDEVLEWIDVAEKLRGCTLPLLTCYNRSRPSA